MSVEPKGVMHNNNDEAIDWEAIRLLDDDFYTYYADIHFFKRNKY